VRKKGGRLPLVQFLIVMCVFLFALPDAAKAEEGLHDLSFGSERVFRYCWSEEELQGRPEDKIIVRTTGLLPQPPRITAPLDALCPTKLTQRNSIRCVIPPRNEKVVALTFVSGRTKSPATTMRLSIICAATGSGLPFSPGANGCSPTRKKSCK
jgi:hypothetical protein